MENTLKEDMEKAYSLIRMELRDEEEDDEEPDPGSADRDEEVREI